MITHITDRIGHEAAIYAIVYDVSKSTVYTADGNGWIVKWSTDLSEQHGVLVANADISIFSLMIIDESNILLAGDMHGYIHVIDLSTMTIKRRILAHPKGVFAMIVNENNLYSIGADGKVAKWDCFTMELLVQKNISKVGLRSMIECKDHFYVGDGSGFIYKIDDQLQPIFSWPAHKTTVFALEVQRNMLFSGGRDAMLSTWNTTNHNLILQEAAHWYAINKILIIEDNIITLSRDKKIRVWNTDKLSLTQSIDFLHKGHIRSVNTGIYLGDQKQLWTVGDDMVIKVWQDVI